MSTPNPFVQMDIPDFLLKHPNVHFEHANSLKAFVKVCRICKTYLANCHCGNPVLMDAILNDPERGGFNKPLIDIAEANKTPQTASVAPTPLAVEVNNQPGEDVTATPV